MVTKTRKKSVVRKVPVATDVAPKFKLGQEVFRLTDRGIVTGGITCVVLYKDAFFYLVDKVPHEAFGGAPEISAYDLFPEFSIHGSKEDLIRSL